VTGSEGSDHDPSRSRSCPPKVNEIDRPRRSLRQRRALSDRKRNPARSRCSSTQSCIGPRRCGQSRPSRIASHPHTQRRSCSYACSSLLGTWDCSNTCPDSRCSTGSCHRRRRCRGRQSYRMLMRSRRRDQGFFFAPINHISIQTSNASPLRNARVCSAQTMVLSQRCTVCRCFVCAVPLTAWSEARTAHLQLVSDLRGSAQASSVTEHVRAYRARQYNHDRAIGV